MDLHLSDKYVIEKHLYDTVESSYYQVKAHAGDQYYLCRISRKNVISSQEVLKFRQEYEISRRLSAPSILNPQDLIFFGERPSIIFQHFNGTPLSNLAIPLSLKEKLQYAIKITQTLDVIHKHKVIHKSIHPQHILIDRDTEEIRVTGFGDATILSKELPGHLIVGHTGSISTVSPEQSGRMNRPLDYRTDFYSLGGTLYYLFVNQSPFSGADALEILHKHLAATPCEPHQIDPMIPKMVSAIIMRLLSKNAQARYQSVYGIEQDLIHCAALFEKADICAQFPLARSDYAAEFHLASHKLYGREKEVNYLLSAFDRATLGARECVFIAGYSGVGKSSIVHEIQPSISQKKGFFITGKYGQNNRDIPYYGLTVGITQLIRQILGESAEVVQKWSDKILAALGRNGKVLFEILPDLELIIGPQPDIAEIGAAQEQNRLCLFFSRFVRALATHENPITLFLDDMQWIDNASLNLLKTLLCDEELTHILLIGAYRDNEVESSHPLLIMTHEALQKGPVISYLQIKPLEVESITELLFDTFAPSVSDVSELALLFKQKTDGNPFFIGQLTEMLVTERKIFFDREQRRYTWSVAQLREADITENIVDLMVQKLGNLPSATREMLCICSAISGQFKVKDIENARELSAIHVIKDLWPAVQAGFLVVRDNDAILLQQVAALIDHPDPTHVSQISMKFLHDRVQQGAYVTLNDEERERLHLEIGLRLKSLLGRENEAVNIFDVVGHLNIARQRLFQIGLRHELAILNLQAGLKAGKASAHSTAASYFQTGYAIINEELWLSDFDLCQSLCFYHAQSCFTLARLDEAESLFLALLSRTRTASDKAKIYKILVDLYTTNAQIPKAVDSAIKGLDMLGVAIDYHPSREQVLAAYERISAQLRDRSIESLIDLPRMDDKSMELAMSILGTMMPPALFFDENLLYMELILMVEISLKYGNAAPSCHGYSYFGMVVGSLLGDYQLGYKFGKLGYDLLSKHGFEEFRAKVCLSFGNVVNYWVNHVNSDLAYLEDGFTSAIENGDITYSCYLCNHIAMALLASGTRLDVVYEDIEQRKKYVSSTGYREIVEVLVSKERLVQLLRGLTSGYDSYAAPGFDDEQFERDVTQGMSIKTCWHHIHRVQAKYMFGYVSEALESAQKARELLWSTGSHIELAYFHFFYALALAANYPSLSDDKKEAALTEIEENCLIFEGWQKNCKSNFYHKYALIRAEISALKGEVTHAMRYYEEAIASATEHGFVQYVALGYELYAKFNRTLGAPRVSKTLYFQALQNYSSWGADGKVRHLKQEIGSLLGAKETLGVMLPHYSGSEVQDVNLDLTTFNKAVQSISREIDRESLLKKILTLVVEYAGAEKGAVVVQEGVGFKIEAQMFEDKTTQTAPHTPDVEMHFPANVIRYVMRSSETVLLDDAASHPLHSNDPYIAKKQCKSILCLPIKYLGATSRRVVLLENNLTSGAFRTAALGLLDILISQAAIALENSEFYAKLKLSEQKYRQLHETMRDAFVLCRLDGIILECNQTYLDMLGYSLDEIKQITYQQLTPVKWHDHEAKIVESQIMIYGDSRVYEKEYIRKNGEIFPIEIRSFLFRDENEKPISIWAIVRDISERKRNENDLKVARDLAEKASASKSEFLANMSHELRTPLNGIIGFSQLLAELSLPSKAAEFVSIINNCGKHLFSLISNLLDLAKIETGKAILKIAPLSFHTIVKEMEDLFHTKARDKGIRLSFGVQNVSAVHLGDELKIKQIIINLVDNAIKFSNRGEVTLNIAWDPLPDSSMQAIKIIVKDTGIGIDEDKRQRLFEKFVQGEHYMTKKHGGSGLGLSIVKGLVDLMAGDITLVTAKNEGTEFTVKLNLKMSSM